MALSLLFNLSIQFVMPFFAISKLCTAQNLHDWIFVTCFQKRTPCGLPAGSAHHEHLQSLIFCGLLRPSTHPLPKPFPLPPHPSRCVLLGRGCGIMAPRVAPGVLSPCSGKKYPSAGRRSLQSRRAVRLGCAAERLCIPFSTVSRSRPFRAFRSLRSHARFTCRSLCQKGFACALCAALASICKRAALQFTSSRVAAAAFFGK